VRWIGRELGVRPLGAVAEAGGSRGVIPRDIGGVQPIRREVGAEGDQVPQPLRMVQRQVQSHDTAVAPTHDIDAIDVQLIEQRDDVFPPSRDR
jgi:hypothetical protein